MSNDHQQGKTARRFFAAGKAGRRLIAFRGLSMLHLCGKGLFPGYSLANPRWCRIKSLVAQPERSTAAGQAP
jgi:hypothetical protein